MFPRETRLTAQDFVAYRMAGVTYDRGAVFDTDLGPVSLALGIVNGIEAKCEGIDINTSTTTASYYFMRNVKGLIEFNWDFQPKDKNISDAFGHNTKERYFLVGFDTAF